MTPPKISFAVCTGRGTAPETAKVGRGANFRCLACGDVASESYIKAEALGQRMAAQLIATVAEGNRRRVYLAPDNEQVATAASAMPKWRPTESMPDNARWFSPPIFGLDTYAKLFTDRQLVALDTFSELIGEARSRALADALSAGMANDQRAFSDGGNGAAAYADAVASYLAFVVSKLADWSNSLCSYIPSIEGLGHLFSRQSIPMVWDFAEINVLSDSAGNFSNHVEWVADMVAAAPAGKPGTVVQRDATVNAELPQPVMVCTDPPYYDNIGYADLSDFFYVWLRRSLADVWPTLFSTLLTPKAEELIASPHRFGGNKQAAQRFFEDGLGRAFARMRETHSADFPLTVFYAFKQSEATDVKSPTDASLSIASTGWETMLEGLLKSGFMIDGTWPLRTERSARSVSIGTNALASSILLVCRPRNLEALDSTRRQFLTELQRELPVALRNLQHGSIAPVDLAQAAIGPGMAVFSRYARVLESNGTAMRVRTALALINQVLSETLSEQEGEMDADTRWAVTWFDQFGFAEGAFGDADTLAKAKNTSTDGLVQAGIVAAARGRVRLLKREELVGGWDPRTDARRTVWECTHHLIRELEHHGESSAARLLKKLGDDGERARELAYRLYATCERRGWAAEAIAYNGLAAAWFELTRMSADITEDDTAPAPQRTLGL